MPVRVMMFALAGLPFFLLLLEWMQAAAVDTAGQQPPQMSQEWWNLHYSTMFRERNISTDPRKSGDASAGELFGTDLNDQEHFESALLLSEAAIMKVEGSRTAGAQGVRLEALIVGCGLSPLVFALADRGAWSVRCLEISSDLVEQLQLASQHLPRPPRFEVGDLTSSSLSSAFGQADLIIDENLLDGMGCTFPVSLGLEAQERALRGLKRLLRPDGVLLTLSFLPLTTPSGTPSPAFRGWELLEQLPNDDDDDDEENYYPSKPLESIASGEALPLTSNDEGDDEEADSHEHQYQNQPEEEGESEEGHHGEKGESLQKARTAPPGQVPLIGALWRPIHVDPQANVRVKQGIDEEL